MQAIDSPTKGVHSSDSAQKHPERSLEIQRKVLEIARREQFLGYSKHDALNSPWLELLAGQSETLRMAFIQMVMRCPIHVRPLLGVRKERNPKGLALFARAHLSRYRLLGDESDAEQARHLLQLLIDYPSPGDVWRCWGYPYPWQDVGFFAPRGYGNRVVTSMVVHSMLDAFETLGDSRYLVVAEDAVRFLLHAPKTLFEDDKRRCVSYVPSEQINWIVLDIPAVTGACVARLASTQKKSKLMAEAARLIRYVVSKQTHYAAWYYAEPPSASHITHDNYHTGFILDSISTYGYCAESSEFDDAYRRGLRFYEESLFESDGAPRFMSDKKYPFDIHGAAQGVITFALAQARTGSGGEMSRKILNWTLDNMYDPSSGWFYYQRRRVFRTRIPLLRWCQAWMAWALACHTECCK